MAEEEEEGDEATPPPPRRRRLACRQGARQAEHQQEVGMGEAPAAPQVEQPAKSYGRQAQACRNQLSIASRSAPQARPRPQETSAHNRKKDQTERDRRKKGDKAERRPP